MARALLWLRRDLRRADHPALAAAAAEGPVVPLFVLDPRVTRHAHRAAGLGRVLACLTDAYEGALVVRVGDPTEIVPAVAREVAATSVHVTADFTPAGRVADEAVGDALDGVPLVATGSPYAVAPGTVLNRGGSPYQVFTPFSKAWADHGWEPPTVEPRGLRLAGRFPSDPLPDLASTGGGDAAVVPVTEVEASRRWQEFLDGRLDAYDAQRDRPDTDATSRLSAALRWGTVHPRTLLAALASRTDSGAGRFVTELAWREFYADALWHHPASAWQDLRPLGIGYADAQDPAVGVRIEAWRSGQTGFPLVDAGMRQLAAIGWMHNRVRMVTASFLTKHLGVWWPVGARHFADNLADYDLASNSHGWQWVAGTGTDASPYFRIFNPTSQGLKYDPAGDYVRAWVPELRHLEGSAAHQPWKHAEGLAHGYPRPIVDHDEARAEALTRYELARRERQS